MIRYLTIKNTRSQRGAMFGLDARIALAIFAGLSVIAGMAIFNSIRETDVTALVSEFDNISKGYINYAFDTGIDVIDGTGAGQGIRGLYEPTAAGPPVTPLGWDGPYITRSTDDHPKFGVYEIIRADIDTSLAVPDSSGTIEGAWLQLTGVPCETAADLDAKVDGEALTPLDGNVRMVDPCPSGSLTDVYYLLTRTM